MICLIVKQLNIHTFLYFSFFAPLFPALVYIFTNFADVLAFEFAATFNKNPIRLQIQNFNIVSFINLQGLYHQKSFKWIYSKTQNLKYFRLHAKMFKIWFVQYRNQNSQWFLWNLLMCNSGQKNNVRHSVNNLCLLMIL